MAIVEQAHLPALLEARRDLPALEHVIVVDGEAPEGGMTLAELDEAGAPRRLRPRRCARRRLRTTSLTLIYTSGTTGPPKGVELTHRNILAAVRAVQTMIDLPLGAKVISWLPAAHIAERTAHHYLPIVYACTVTTCPDPRRIVEVLPQVHPTWFFAVPRIWEKLKAGLEAMLAGQPEEARAKVQAALDASLQAVRLRQAGEPVPAELAAAVEQADGSCSAGCARCSGSTRSIAVNVGAAPTPREVIEFFHAIGIELAELWGMSETCGAGACNQPGRGADRHGRAGDARRRAESSRRTASCSCAAAVVMRGYRNRPSRRPRRSAPTAGSRPATSRDRRRRLRADRRPQEGADHQRRRQEHVARRTSRRR